MSLTAFKVRGSDNSDLQIAIADFPATISFSNLTPVDGDFPTFTENPIVYVLNPSFIYVSSVDYSAGTFTLARETSGYAPGTYTIDIAVETGDTPSTTPVGTVVRSAPYYCSILDVKEKIINACNVEGHLDFTALRQHISHAYGKIQAALTIGGYSLPVTLSTQALLTTALTAADTLVTITLDSDYSTSSFPVGSTVRINGDLSATRYGDEFVNVTSLTSNTQLVVEWLKQSYQANTGTIELCTNGFLILRECNACGAAAAALDSVFNVTGDRNDATTDLRESFNQCLEALKAGEISEITKDSNAIFIESYQSQNSTADDVINAPIWKTSAKW